MYTSRERRTGHDKYGLRQSSSTTPSIGCFCRRPLERCSSNANCRMRSHSPSTTICPTISKYTCTRPVPTPHFSRKTVRFDHRNPNLGCSRSVSRGGFHNTERDSGSIYIRHGSPCTLSRPRSVLHDANMMEHANLNVLLRRLSILQLEMKGLLNGRSLRERVQMIGQKLHDDTPPLSSSRVITPCKDVWLLADNEHTCTHHVSLPVERQKWLTPSGETQLQHGFELSKVDELNQVDGLCDANTDSDGKEEKQIVQLWRDYNCDIHLGRIIDGSRKEGACRILEKVVHAQLTHNMQQYIAAVAKGLMGSEKTHYLSFFKREGPFRNKPLNEGTYGELLSFVDKQAKPARDVLKALDVAEEGLEEEVCRGGYDPNAIGNIRAQMRIFLSVVASAPCLTSTATSISQCEDDETMLSRDFLQDLVKAADRGKLGTLQSAQRVIKLACFLALKQVESST